MYRKYNTINLKKKKNILIIGAGVEQIPGIIRLKEIGFNVFSTDININAPAFKYCKDHKIASTMNISETIIKAKELDLKYKLDGVMTFAADVPLTVVKTAQALSLWSISENTAKISSCKILMKNVLKKNSIPVPDYKEIKKFEEIFDFIDDSQNSYIIKPSDSRGARGVIRLNKKDNIDIIENKYRESLTHSLSKRLLLEKWIEGPQLSTESIFINNKIYTLGFSDRNYDLLNIFYPFVIENGGQSPSNLYINNKKKIDSLLSETAKAIGLETGVIKGDIVWDIVDKKFKIIEFAVRLSGGYFSTDQIPLLTGCEPVCLIAKISTMEKIEPTELQPNINGGVAIRYFFPKQGKIKKIIKTKKITTPNLIKLVLFVKEGDIIYKTDCHPKRAGFVITLGENKEEAVFEAEEIINNFNFIIEK